MNTESKEKVAALFLNGEPPHAEPLARAFEHNPTFFLFTDGAYDYAKAINIEPNLVIGDFDSTVVADANIQTLKIDNQDTTDFEKALQYLRNEGFTKVVVLGSTGKQHDHFLGNLSAALKYKVALNILFFDQSQYFFLIERNSKVETQQGKIISLYPFPEATGIVTSGLKYPLNNETLNMHQRIGTRNIATSKDVSISIKTGDIWIFVSY